ncbi:hypothetical protein ACPOL_1607 [Acidisarcina polymorpha]|uniref:Uncharacterized protein n=1 Tax=Acidisarcina polymorpha TaxID=2211140 RepID=A0A2Z5FVN6_9BACT|nr:hypothetical protein ACPOL_1607 [Acidisarcina polymorpha]
MNVAKVTVSATAQGLWLGFQSCMSGNVHLSRHDQWLFSRIQISVC